MSFLRLGQGGAHFDTDAQLKLGNVIPCYFFCFCKNCMMYFKIIVMKIFFLCFISFFCVTSINAENIKDWRNIQNAIGIIPDENYCDQPYVVVTKDGKWVCVLTTGTGTESQQGQHIAASISCDQGRTWSSLIDIESSDLPPSSWAVPYITSYGRIYVFYTFNGDNVTSLNGRELKHNTELGWYCYKYSDDEGSTWSERYRLPMKKTTVDYINPFNGDVQLFWGISKPVIQDGIVYFAFTKMAIHPQDMGEGFLYKSENLDYEKDVNKIVWELLPEEGICETTLGVTQEEHNIVPLNNGGLYCVMRTSEGYPADCYSYDGGYTWTKPQYVRYANGNVIKNPRACPRVFKCNNRKYLLWYHNNNIRGYKGHRNPVWLSGGVEKDGKIWWSQPEVLLYSNDSVGISYPDLIEVNSRFWITETQKTIARVHPVDSNLLYGLWGENEVGKKALEALMIDRSDLAVGDMIECSQLFKKNENGLTIELLLNLSDLVPGDIIIDNRDNQGDGLCISVSSHRTLEISLYDKKQIFSWDTDPGVVKIDQNQHVVFVIDNFARLITTVVNGILCDGGRYRTQGWKRLGQGIGNVLGDSYIRIPSFNGSIKQMRVYNRYLTTSEVIAIYNDINSKK